jgi:pimeloyl-ACP methyl ester carboxylesterase
MLPVAVALMLTFACAADAPDDGREATRADVQQLENGSFTAVLNGYRIHYEVHGAGPVLMTVPNSWGLSLEGLRAMYRPLEAGLTLVYFDPRGMGGSEAVREDADHGLEAVRADVHALREHLGLDAVHAIGWSNGATNLIFLAHERPETLESAIFLHTGASYTEQDGRRLQERYPHLMQAFGEFMKNVAPDPDLTVDEKTERMRSLWLDTYFPAASADTATARTRLRQAFADAEFSWPHAEYTQRTLPGFEARDLLPRIGVRSLVIAGRHDLLPPEYIRPLADGLPDAQFVVFEGSGHFAPLEEPDAFRNAVFAFLGVTRAP